MRVVFVLVALSAFVLVLGDRGRNTPRCPRPRFVLRCLKSAERLCNAGKLGKATKIKAKADGYVERCSTNKQYQQLKTELEAATTALEACLNPPTTPPPNPVCDAVAVTCPAGQCNGGTFCSDIGGTACESQSCPADQQCCVI